MAFTDPYVAFGMIAAAALGLIFGSFANVCIHRIPEGRSVVWPGSACPACHAAIRWYDNIPVLSWLLLAGRCRSCRSRIPPVYPLVELVTGLLLLTLYMQLGPSVRWVALSWMTVSIIILVPIDIRFGILPDRVTLPGIVVGLLASPLGRDPGPGGALAGALAGALVPLGIRALYMVYARIRRGGRTAPGDDAEAGQENEPERREGMGLGDVKMLAMVGAFLGTPRVLLTMLLGSVLGSLYVLPMVVSGRHNMKTPVPFGPFLGLAALVSMFWGSEIIRWYLDLVVTLPFGG